MKVRNLVMSGFMLATTVLGCVAYKQSQKLEQCEQQLTELMENPMINFYVSQQRLAKMSDLIANSNANIASIKNSLASMGAVSGYSDAAQDAIINAINKNNDIIDNTKSESVNLMNQIEE